MTAPVSTKAHGVSEISAHEAAEQARVQNSKASFATKESTLRKQHAETERHIESEERTAASAELQVFGAEEIPRILQAGESARSKAISDVDAHARSAMPSELKTIVKKASSHILSF